MNAHTQVSKAAAMPRRVKKVADEIVRLARRPQGVSIEEVSALSGMKEQTARSRLSKLKQQGFVINRDPSTGMYHLIPPARRSKPDGEYYPHERQGDEALGPVSQHIEAQLADQNRVIADEASSRADKVVNVSDRSLRRLIQIISEHRELHMVQFQGRIIFSWWNDHGVQQMEHVDVDLKNAIS